MKCCQQGCQNVAEFQMQWPGTEGHKPLCIVHSTVARGVALALGFQLPVSRLELPEEEKGRRLQERVRSKLRGVS